MEARVRGGERVIHGEEELSEKRTAFLVGLRNRWETTVADKVRETQGTQITEGPVDHLRASALTLDERRTFRFRAEK